VTNFAQQLSAALAEDAERPAVKLDDIVLNYGFLDEAAARAAGLLRSKGVGEGDRVGMQLPNVPYFPIVYFGALRLGAVVVPMNPLLKQREVAYQMRNSGARVVIGWHQFAEPAVDGASDAGAEAIIAKPGEFEQLLGAAEPVREVASRGDDDPAVIIYTSGTTGTPKGAMLTHANIAAAAQTGRDLVDAGPHTVTVATLPLFHVFGMSAIMNVTICGHGLLTMVPRFEPGKVLEVIGPAAPPRARATDCFEREPVRLGRGADAGRGAAGLRRGVRGQGARGLWALGDLRDGHVQPTRPRA
jgi:long-chain acyl-CoA synthetase